VGSAVLRRGMVRRLPAKAATDQELTAYWSDIQTVARAIERIYEPCQLNYMTFGNAVPHVHTHTVTTAAVTASAQSGWAVPKFYWTVLSTSAMTAALAGLTEVPDGWHRPEPSDIYFGYPDDKIDAVVDASAHVGTKAAALAAHATQVMVAPDRRTCALSNNMALPIAGKEHYVLAAGAPGPRDARGWETDLLAGLDLG